MKRTECEIYKVKKDIKQFTRSLFSTADALNYILSIHNYINSDANASQANGSHGEKHSAPALDSCLF